MMDETTEWIYDRHTMDFRRLIDAHGSRVARVEVLHVASDGGPFTDVTLCDAQGKRFDSRDRGPLPTENVKGVLRERFTTIKRLDDGKDLFVACFAVEGYRAPAT